MNKFNCMMGRVHELITVIKYYRKFQVQFGNLRVIISYARYSQGTPFSFIRKNSVGGIVSYLFFPEKPYEHFFFALRPHEFHFLSWRRPDIGKMCSFSCGSGI